MQAIAGPDRVAHPQFVHAEPGDRRCPRHFPVAEPDRGGDRVQPGGDEPPEMAALSSLVVEVERLRVPPARHLDDLVSRDLVRLARLRRLIIVGLLAGPIRHLELIANHQGRRGQAVPVGDGLVVFLGFVGAAVLELNPSVTAEGK